MNRKILTALVTGTAALLIALASPLARADGKFSLYNRFDPGQFDSAPQYATGPWIFKLISSPNAGNLPQLGHIKTESATGSALSAGLSGLDNTEAAATFNLYSGSASTPEIDLTGKVKVNADKNRIYGFTQNDYAAQMDVYQSMDKFTAKGSLGSKVLGSNPTGIILNPMLYGSFGGIYQFTGQTSTGVDMSLSQNRSSAFGIVQPELSAYVSYKLDKNFKARGYVLRRFANGNPNNTVGGQVYYGF